MPCNELTVIITMAGAGSRFREAGYNVPKYQIEARGKTLFDWSMDSLLSLQPHVKQYVFVVREEDMAEEFVLKRCRARGITRCKVVALDHMTDGQATTCLYALPYCDRAGAILIYNIDTYVEKGALRYEDISGDGFLPCFHADGDHWSFVKRNARGEAIEVREKQRISDTCTIGAYYFASADLYRELYDAYYQNTPSSGAKEKYIAPLYNLMIARGERVLIRLIDADKVHVLGTPEELARFIDEGKTEEGKTNHEA